MDALLGPVGSPLRRLRTFLAFILTLLLVVGVVAAVLGQALPLVWALVLTAVFVLGHLWSWPRRDGRLDPYAAFTPGWRAAVASGLAVGAASAFGIVLQGGTAVQALLQTAVTAAVIVPVLLAAGWWQRRRTSSS